MHSETLIRMGRCLGCSRVFAGHTSHFVCFVGPLLELKLSSNILLAHSCLNRYSCELCEKSFTKSSDLAPHMLIHTGEKPYSCDTCSRSFRHLNSLRRHKVIHTGQKPYTCVICGKGFGQASTLANEPEQDKTNKMACDIRPV